MLPSCMLELQEAWYWGSALEVIKHVSFGLDSIKIFVIKHEI